MKSNEKGIEHFRSRATVWSVLFAITLLAAIIAGVAYIGAEGRKEVLQAENDQLSAAVVSLQARNWESEVLRQDFCMSQVGDQLAWHDAETVRDGDVLKSTITCGLLDGSTREFAKEYDLGASMFQ